MKICNNCIDLRKQKKEHFYICLNPKSELFKIPFPHGKTRKACNIYKPRLLPLVPLVPQIVPRGMKFIEDLRCKEFEGSDFWIIGTDPNVDFYPDDFFDDKFSIAVNLAWAAFPRSTFFMGSGSSIYPEQMRNAGPSFLKRCILPLDFILPNPPSSSIGRWERWGLDPIYMRPERKYGTSSSPDFEPLARQVLNAELCEFPAVRTGAHLATCAAIALGAKRVILSGCPRRVAGGRVYAQKRGIGADNKPGKIRTRGSERTFWRFRRDLAQLARTFGKYGIEVMRNRFDPDRNEFIFEEIRDGD